MSSRAAVWNRAKAEVSDCWINSKYSLRNIHSHSCDVSWLLVSVLFRIQPFCALVLPTAQTQYKADLAASCLQLMFYVSDIKKVF